MVGLSDAIVLYIRMIGKCGSYGHLSELSAEASILQSFPLVQGRSRWLASFFFMEAGSLNTGCSRLSSTTILLQPELDCVFTVTVLDKLLCPSTLKLVCQQNGNN